MFNYFPCQIIHQEMPEVYFQDEKPANFKLMELSEGFNERKFWRASHSSLMHLEVRRFL